MLRSLRGARDILASTWRSLALPSGSRAFCTVDENANKVEEPREKTVGDAAGAEEAVEENAPLKEKRLTISYSTEALAKLKLDQYPLYVEREWWKTGNRMTFWATWRQLRDVKRREQVQRVGADRMRLKAIKGNTILPQAIRDEAAEKLFKAPKYDHPRLILNMCMFTGRQRGKIKPYRVNRHIFRRLADHGQLSGVQRAMW